MDPERARKLFEQAAVFSVQTSSGLAELYRLTPDQESFVKQSTKRSDTLMLAKKYIKAADAVEELEKALSAFPGLDSSLAPVPIQRQPQPYQVRGPGNGQIVPYIPVAPARYQRAACRQEWGLDWFNLNVAVQRICAWRVWGWYWFALKTLIVILAFAPLLILVAFTVQVVAAVLYVAAHPELMIKASFSIAQFFPNLAAQAVNNMADQYVAELTSMWSSLR